MQLTWYILRDRFKVHPQKVYVSEVLEPKDGRLLSLIWGSNAMMGINIPGETLWLKAEMLAGNVEGYDQICGNLWFYITELKVV